MDYIGEKINRFTINETSMKFEVECEKILYDPTAYSLKYKGYKDAEGTILIYLNRHAHKGDKIPRKIKVTVEWDEQIV